MKYIAAAAAAGVFALAAANADGCTSFTEPTLEKQTSVLFDSMYQSMQGAKVVAQGSNPKGKTHWTSFSFGLYKAVYRVGWERTVQINEEVDIQIPDGYVQIAKAYDKPTKSLKTLFMILGIKEECAKIDAPYVRDDSDEDIFREYDISLLPPVERFLKEIRLRDAVNTPLEQPKQTRAKRPKK